MKSAKNQCRILVIELHFCDEYPVKFCGNHERLVREVTMYEMIMQNFRLPTEKMFTEFEELINNLSLIVKLIL